MGRIFSRKKLLAIVLVMLNACTSPEEKVKQYLAEADAFYSHGEYVKADIAYRNVLQSYGSHVEALYGRARVSERQGDLKKTYQLYSRLIEVAPEHVQGRVVLGKLYLASGQLDMALEQSRAASELAPRDAGVLALKAAVRYRLADTEGAIHDAKMALEADSGNIDALLILAAERLAAEDPEAAIDYLERGLEGNEDNVALQVFKIQALDQMKELDRAVNVFRRLIEFYPEDVVFQHALARLYIQNDNIDAAESIYRNLAATETGEVQARLDMVRFLLAYRDAAKAEQQLRAYIDASPDNYDLRFGLAEFYLQSKDLPRARIVYEEVVIRDGNGPDGLTARNQLAVLALAEGDRATADRLVAEVLAADPQDTLGLINRANIQLQARETNAAIANLRTVLKDDPDSSRALLLLARAHIQSGAQELARDYYIRAVQSDSSQVAISLEYALFLIRTQSYEKAEQVLEAVLAKQPGNANALKAMEPLEIKDLEGLEKQLIKFLDKKAAKIERMIDELVASDPELEKNHRICRSVPGVGTSTSSRTPPSTRSPWSHSCRSSRATIASPVQRAFASTWTWRDSASARASPGSSSKDSRERYVMRRPDYPASLWAAILAGVLAAQLAMAPAPARAELPTEIIDDWYRVELLIFLREDDAALASEAWDPLPELRYPDTYRHLIDPGLADRRLRESGAYASVIDERGVQYLLLPAPFSTVEVEARPDVLINQPWEEPADNAPADGTSGDPEPAAGDDPPGERANEGLDATPAPADGEDEALPPRLRVLPFRLLEASALDFTPQARSLRRRGERVLFHGAWWQYLPQGHAREAIALDRGADSDLAPWPELQGSVLVYRSRYLHIDVDLWLNTLGSYLPEGWQIDAPPVTDSTLVGETLAGEVYDPWAPAALLTDSLSGNNRAEAPAGISFPDPAEAASRGERDAPREAQEESDGDTAAVLEATPYPWQHAIAHRQTRRMRSDEIHYLDHPVIGVVVRLRPASDALPPFAEDAERAFRERHGLPIVEVNPEQLPRDSD